MSKLYFFFSLNLYQSKWRNNSLPVLHIQAMLRESTEADPSKMWDIGWMIKLGRGSIAETTSNPKNKVPDLYTTFRLFYQKERPPNVGSLCWSPRIHVRLSRHLRYQLCSCIRITCRAYQEDEIPDSIPQKSWFKRWR